MILGLVAIGRVAQAAGGDAPAGYRVVNTTNFGRALPSTMLEGCRLRKPE
jgi:hypothetical protein